MKLVYFVSYFFLCFKCAFANNYLSENNEFKNIFFSRDVKTLIDLSKDPEEVKYSKLQSTKDKLDIDSNLDKKTKDNLILPGLFISGPPEILCTLREGLYSSESHYSEGFICDLGKSYPEEGVVYTLLRKMEKSDFYEGEYNWDDIYSYVANISFEKIVTTKKVAIGKVLYNNYIPKSGDIVVEYRSVTRKLRRPSVTESPGFKAGIFSFEKLGVMMGEQNSFAFLDKGSSSGLEEGSVYNIYRSFNTDSVRFEINPSKVNNSKAIGQIEVVLVGGRGAIGYITEIYSEIILGDIVGDF
jgi:hypothetical protein